MSSAFVEPSDAPAFHIYEHEWWLCRKHVAPRRGYLCELEVVAEIRERGELEMIELERSYVFMGVRCKLGHVELFPDERIKSNNYVDVSWLKSRGVLTHLLLIASSLVKVFLSKRFVSSDSKNITRRTGFDLSISCFHWRQTRWLTKSSTIGVYTRIASSISVMAKAFAVVGPGAPVTRAAFVKSSAPSTQRT